MSRDHVVSVRVTEAELEQLHAMGGPTAALRTLLGRNNAANPLASWSLPNTAVGGYLPPTVGVSCAGGWTVWSDGTVGPMFPAVMTG